MMVPSGFAVVICLTTGVLVQAQTTILIGSCADLPSEVAQDTYLELTNPEISCPTNTPIEVSDGANLEMTSAEASTKLNNVKIWLRAGTFRCSVRSLDWTSVETVGVVDGAQASQGAAVRIEEGTTATFAEDVTFSACALPEEDYPWGSEGGAAIANFGNLIFQGDAAFQDTPSAGALYTSGAVTFEGDATFENNGQDRGSGGGLYIDTDGIATFKGATFFTNNEAAQSGAGLYSHSEAEAPMVFTGPVTVIGNSGQSGALAVRGTQSVIFESLVTFTDNVMGLDDDYFAGGAMYVNPSWRRPAEFRVDFRGGVVATGNTAMNGGVFYYADPGRDVGGVLSISEPVTITGNSALYAGGAIYTEGTVSMPAIAEVSGNAARFCPGIRQVGQGQVVFEGGDTYGEPTKELCYLGSEASASTPADIAEEFDCDLYSASAPVTSEYPQEHPYLVLNTALVKSWDFGSGGGFSCGTQLIVYVTGGGELTVTSTAAASTLSNVRFEVVDFTSLVLDVPDLTLTGIDKSRLGGSIFVDVGSKLDVMNKITFLGNSNKFSDDTNGGLNWTPRGGAAVSSDGTTTFHGRANFLGNGQYRNSVIGEEASNYDGGALSNSGTMTFMQKAKFTENFNPNGGNGGAVANFGDMVFAVRSIFSDNYVEASYTDDGQPDSGRGGAVFNGGDNSTILFNGLAVFKGNVGALGGGALVSWGNDDHYSDGGAAGDSSSVIFAGKAKFKDNLCGDYPTIYSDTSNWSWRKESKGGGAVLAYGATRVEFSDTAVFKRNEAANGGSIVNSAFMSFVSDAKLFTADNVATETCPDIFNSDFGTTLIGTETFAGSSPLLCERPSAPAAPAAPAT